MNENLLARLIEKNYFECGVVVRAIMRRMDMCGIEINSFEQDFIITAMGKSRKTGDIILTAHSHDGYKYKFRSRDILMIDGMTPERFGQNYLLDNDGKDLNPLGKRRGRKPRDYNKATDVFYARD